MKEQDILSERITIAADAAFAIFLQEISSHYQVLCQIASQYAHLDALSALSFTYDIENFSLPAISNEACIHLTKAKHPLGDSSTFVANTIDFQVALHQILAYKIPKHVQLCNQILVLTGPNMGGKSSYVKMVQSRTDVANHR